MDWGLDKNIYEYLPPLKKNEIDFSMFSCDHVLSIAHTPYSSDRHTPVDIVNGLKAEGGFDFSRFIPHIKTATHKDVSTLRSEILFFKECGVRRFLLVSGDKNSGLMAGLNTLDVLESLCLGFPSTCFAVAFDPYEGETEYLRTHLKIERGAVSVWSQPVFDREVLHRIASEFKSVATYVSVPLDSELKQWPKFRQERLGARRWSDDLALALREEAQALGLSLKMKYAAATMQSDAFG